MSRGASWSRYLPANPIGQQLVMSIRQPHGRKIYKDVLRSLVDQSMLLISTDNYGYLFTFIFKRLATEYTAPLTNSRCSPRNQRMCLSNKASKTAITLHWLLYTQGRIDSGGLWQNRIHYIFRTRLPPNFPQTSFSGCKYNVNATDRIATLQRSSMLSNRASREKRKAGREH